MGNGSMWNGTAVYCVRIDFQIFVRDFFERWKSLESEFVMMFSVTLVCWDYRDPLLLTKVHTNHQETVSWGYSSTGSNEDF